MLEGSAVSRTTGNGHTVDEHGIIHDMAIAHVFASREDSANIAVAI